MIRKWFLLPEKIRLLINFVAFSWIGGFCIWKIFHFFQRYAINSWMSDLFQYWNMKTFVHAVDLMFFIVLMSIIFICNTAFKEKKIAQSLNNYMASVEDTQELLSVIDEYNYKLKQWEEEVYRKRRCLVKIIDIVDRFIFVKDSEGVFVLVNKKVAECYGVHPRDIVGHKDSEFTSEFDHFINDDLDVIKSGVCKLGIREKIICSSGKERWLITDKYPFETWEGKPAVLGISRIEEIENV